MIQSDHGRSWAGVGTHTYVCAAAGPRRDVDGVAMNRNSWKESEDFVELLRGAGLASDARRASANIFTVLEG